MIALDLRLPLEARELVVKAELGSGAVAVLGPSGAGKTSLLEAIAGLRPRARGRVVVDGHLLQDDAAGIRLSPERREIGYVPQDALLFPHLTAERNLRFGQPRTPEGERAAAEAIALFELGPLLSRRPEQLSGGERQRVALARALARCPRLLLLDEPLAALDLALRDRVLPYLLRLKAARVAPFLYVTHQRSEARLLADEVLLLEQGGVLACGPTREVLAQGERVLGREGRPWVALEGVLAREGEKWDLQVAGASLRVPPEPGLSPGPAVYLLHADEVLLSKAAPQDSSVRNVLPAVVTELVLEGGDVQAGLRAGRLELSARITRQAADELAISLGAAVYVAFKAHALRRA